MAQLTTIVARSGACLYLRCPYHAIIINVLEIIRSATVFNLYFPFPSSLVMLIRDCRKAIAEDKEHWQLVTTFEEILKLHIHEKDSLNTNTSKLLHARDMAFRKRPQDSLKRFLEIF